MDYQFSLRYRDLYERHWWFRAREEFIIQFLRERQPSKGWELILDVGCGDALFFRELSQFGTVEGVEPVAGVISLDNPFRSSIHIGPFDQTFQPSKRFSLILMLDVLEHLDDPVKALRHAVSLLRPGGSILITVPAFTMLWTTHDDLNSHFTRYTKASFQHVADEASMKIVQSRYLFFWLFLAKMAVRAKEKLVTSKPTIPKVPISSVNRLLLACARLEEKLFGRLPIPFGSSLLVLGQSACVPELTTDANSAVGTF